MIRTQKDDLIDWRRLLFPWKNALSDTNLIFLSSSSKEWRLHGGAKFFGDLYNGDQDLKSLSAELEALIDQHKVEGLVVGYPFRNPEKSDDGLNVLMFISNLNYTQKFGGLKYTYWDKAFTPKGYLYSGMLLVGAATARGLAPKRHWV
ncbi:hypothetical protein QYF36_002373 [Acer negundo]|nr:hypothetical protein QYF36_002373 [Acer negundo]